MDNLPTAFQFQTLLVYFREPFSSRYGQITPRTTTISKVAAWRSGSIVGLDQRS